MQYSPSRLPRPLMLIFACALSITTTRAAFAQVITPKMGAAPKVKSQTAKPKATINASSLASTANRPQIDFGTLDQGVMSDTRVLRAKISSLDSTDRARFRFSNVRLSPVDNIDLGMAAVSSTAALDLHGSIAGPFAGIVKDGDTDFTADFKVETNCPGTSVPSDPKIESDCFIVVGFTASQEGSETVLLSIGEPPSSGPQVQLVGAGTSVKLASPAFSYKLLPISRFKYTEHSKSRKDQETKAVEWLQKKIGKDFGREINTIEGFYHGGSGSQFDAFTQFNMIYNAAASSATMSADIATLDFFPGIEVAVATSLQTGAGEATTPTASSSASLVSVFLRPRAADEAFTTPTLSATQAAQSAQNLINGGNLYVHATYPIFSNNPAVGSAFRLLGVVRARDGVDIPNFAGTSTVTSDPINHFSAHTEWLAEYQALANAGSAVSAGSIFADASLGYGYSSHTFTQQNGFGNHVQYLLGQVSAGISFNHTIQLAVQRNFGPSQTYIDSTTTLPTTQNQFKTWSMAINYTK